MKLIAPFRLLLLLVIVYSIDVVVVVNCNDNDIVQQQQHEEVVEEEQQQQQTVYGTEVSWPMQYPYSSTNNPKTTTTTLTTTINENTRYIEYMNGCYERYNYSICNEYEMNRIQQNYIQPKNVYKNYTYIGYAKIPSPKIVYDTLRQYWDQYSVSYLQYEHPNNDIHDDDPNNHIPYIYTNHWVAPTKVLYIDPPPPPVSSHISSKNTKEQQLLPRLSYTQQQVMIDHVQHVLEQWSHTKLRFTSLYGIRAYTNQSILVPHIDRYPLILSAIVNVAQVPTATQQQHSSSDNNNNNNSNNWVIEMIGHDGIATNITMEPGDMILYESHSVLHGRPYPLLHHQYYANCFFHFEPLDYDYTATTTNTQSKKTTQMKFDEALQKMTQQQQRQLQQQQKESKTTSTSSSSTIQLPNYILEGTIEAQRYRQEFEFHRVPLMGTNSDNTFNNIDDTFPLVMYQNSKTGEIVTIKNQEKKSKSNNYNNNAHVLAARNDIKRLRDLARKNPNILHTPDTNGWLPLHEAARGGSTDCILYIVEEMGVPDINARTNDGSGGTALWWAEYALHKDHDVIIILRRNGAISIPPDYKKKSKKKK